MHSALYQGYLHEYVKVLYLYVLIVTPFWKIYLPQCPPRAACLEDRHIHAPSH